MKKGFFIDIQGTLIDDKNFLPLPGSIEFLHFLNQQKIPFVLITNNSKRDSFEFINYLKNLGFEFENYIDPLMVLDSYINNKKIAVYGQEKFVEIINQNYEVDFKNPEIVLLGLKLFSNEEFSEIIEFLLNGSLLIGMHKTSIYSYQNRRYPGLGAIFEMLKYATNCNYKVIGKPSVEFFSKAKEKIELNYDKITIISDDLVGDLLPAKKLGMNTALVLTGKIKNIQEIKQKPDKIYKNLIELMEKEWKKS